MAEEKERRKVKILNAETARKIAAGEVIDRPASIVRELLDNAVDSGATEINVEIEGGGIDKIRVQDNGCGMNREDLAVAAHPHATSKISTDTDLLNLTTLGFRGEALASIAAVARLTISSGEWKMRCSIMEDHIIEPRSPIAGTVVSSENLFENFPARRQFLKRPASETKMCRQTFLEKALPRPDIAFRLSVDGQLRNDFRAGQSLRERFYEALGIQQSPDLFYEIKGSGFGFSFSLVVGDPCVARQDRKDIYIYVNGRRIAEYSLVQAIEYGTQGYFPNGTHPAAALFAQVQPDMVDFNIHPAKKEARFKDIAGLHHGVSSALREFFRALSVRQMKSGLEGTEEERQNAFSFSQESFESPKSAASLSDLADLAGGSSPLGTQPDAASPLGTQSPAPQSYKSQKSAGLSGAAQSWSSGQSPAPQSDASPKSAGLSGAAQSWPSGALPSYGAGRAPRIAERPQNLRVASPAFSAGQNIADAAASWSYDKSAAPSASHQSYESPKSAAASWPCEQSTDAADFKYIGRALGTFIIVEKNKALYFVDQHAAHERYLFDKIMDGQTQRQPLLVPEKIELESEADDQYMASSADELKRYGFECERTGDAQWAFSSFNSLWKGGIIELKKLIFEKRIEPKELIRKIAAMAACRSAVKDGDVIDDAAAVDLAKKAFALPDPHCP
ncbi:MAG: DNA mismatch repair endonuclease MutL, partial [Treponema sp.]|nr:DNA mismatch repair endonuclease MutL [Treponema sp.]